MNKTEISKMLMDMAKSYHVFKRVYKGGREKELEFHICDPFAFGVHVFEGIERLAEAVGREIKTEALDVNDNTYKLSFEYEGAVFFGLEKYSEERVFNE